MGLPAISCPLAEAEQSNGKSSKKAKKAAKAAAANGSAHNDAGSVDLHALADVGDKSLAQKGKRIVKDLFKPHAEAQALTDAQVSQHAHTQSLLGTMLHEAYARGMYLGNTQTHATHMYAILHSHVCVCVCVCVLCVHPQVVDLRRSMTLTLEGPSSDDSRFKPYTKFEHTGLSASMLQCTKDFAKPSPIQSQVCVYICECVYACLRPMHALSARYHAREQVLSHDLMVNDFTCTHILAAALSS